MAKSNLRKSIYSPEHQALKAFLIATRKNLSYSQRELAAKISVGHSYIAKLETGERRLDVVEFVDLMYALDLCPIEQFTELSNKINSHGQ